MTKALGLITAAALLAPTLAAAQTVPAGMIAGTRLDISAEGEVTRAPDLVTINAGVVTQSPTAGAAMTENGTRMTRVVAALKAAGVLDRDIQTGSINLSPQYRYAENLPPEITGYQASNQLTIRFRDIARAGRVLDTLVAQGVNQISGPSFSVEKSDEALDAARTAAVAKARARAELYARAAGLSVKRILTISESGVATPPPPMPMMAFRAASAKMDTTEIAPGEQKLGITVSVSFELG